MNSGFAFDLGEWFDSNAAKIQQNLKRYFDGNEGDRFTGRWFEDFAAMGHPDRYEASDLVAIEALSVRVPTESAGRLLVTEADRFNELLAEIPGGVDIWDVPRSVVDPASAAAQLHSALKTLEDVGYVTAGKLLAAKRPRLIPILDWKVESLLAPPRDQFWVTMHDQLIDGPRREVIAGVCAAAPPGVSLLRRIDVALWMHVTAGLQKRT
ncbi:hypothetical protein EI067_06920 [Mycobacterium paragordonae]|uniref:DUF6308 family protein n=1 Tax=Mycobacterium paragordonae TaxID=1389713 RepID=UPI0010610008|nr:DUF6308 family protein [Mycobacterium paragordonae]TDK99183.1 hypothetical protein EI067_06920 [Mycobacterium paragordonae]